MADKLAELAFVYLSWQAKKEKAEEELEVLKEEIVAEAQKRRVKKVKAGKAYLYIISQSETRFPQLGEVGRSKVEKIVRESGELEDVVIFDIVRLGNAYDQGKLSKNLMEKLAPFAKREKTTKIVVKRLNSSQ